MAGILGAFITPNPTFRAAREAARKLLYPTVKVLDSAQHQVLEESASLISERFRKLMEAAQQKVEDCPNCNGTGVKQRRIGFRECTLCQPLREALKEVL